MKPFIYPHAPFERADSTARILTAHQSDHARRGCPVDRIRTNGVRLRALSAFEVYRRAIAT